MLKCKSVKISKIFKKFEKIKVSKKSNIYEISKILKSVLNSAVLPASLMPLFHNFDLCNFFSEIRSQDTMRRGIKRKDPSAKLYQKYHACAESIKTFQGLTSSEI